MSQALRFSRDPIISLRLKVLEHCQEFGWRSSCHAFSIGKSSLYRWRQAYTRSGNRLGSLKKRSTRPHRLRPMQVHPKVVEAIKRLRHIHCRLGKEKLKPLLDQFCLQHSLPGISVSTVGKVISRYHLFFPKTGRVYHSPQHRHGAKPLRLRQKHAWMPRELGHLQLDTIVKLADGLKRYALSCMDVRGKFTLTLVYPQLTSLTALDTLLKFQLVYPVKIQSVQTDNGLEFQGAFERYLKQQHIKHYFTYPRCPKINACIERYNRTFQEEFWDEHLYLMHHPSSFHQKLLDYLLFFNTQRVHQGLNNQTPMDYLVNEGYFWEK